MTQDENTRALKVGVFTLVALAIAVGLVFTVSARSALLAQKTNYFAKFSDVEGLRSGSPVRLAGIAVGTVHHVSFESDGRCRVEFSVDTRQQSLMRTGSTVSIGSMGFLGDKLLEIAVGPGEAVPPGHEIRVAAAGGLGAAMASAGSLVNDARPAVANVRRFTETLANDQFRADVQALSHNMAELTRMITQEDGTIPRLLRDPSLADDVQATLRAARGATAELAALSQDMRRISHEVATGNGSAHRLIYGSDAADTLASLARSTEEVAHLVRDIREGNGNAHELVYGDGELAQNLTQLSENLQTISGDIRAGRGTLGALIEDPSLYEDVKRLVGNLERNEVLRALVRYSYRHGEVAPATVTPPAN